MKIHCESIIRTMGALIVLFFLAVTVTPASNYLAKQIAVPPTIMASGAIVVLGAGISKEGGTLGDASLRRTIRGIELYKQNLAPLIVFSGESRSDNPDVSEAAVRSELAMAVGIPRQAILKEEIANTTREESVRISKILEERNVHRILLVTESLHMRRAKQLFERAGIEVFPAPSDNLAVAAVSPDERLRLTTRIVQESMALIYYRIAGYIQ